jgi:hypothetical protein
MKKTRSKKSRDTVPQLRNRCQGNDSARQRIYSCIQIRVQATWAGGIDSLESIPGFLKRLQMRALSRYFGRVMAGKIVS